MKTLIYFVGFILSVSRLTAQVTDYTFQLVTAPDYTHTLGYGINNSGAIVFGAGSNETSFLRDPSGSLIEIVYSGHTPTVALGINNLGVIVGDAYNSPAGSYFGFVRALDGAFSNFTYPGAVGPNGGMQTTDINDSGVIVGSYETSPTDGGAFIRLTTGQFQTFRYLDNLATSAYGINNAGQITGQIFDGIPGKFSHQSSFLRHVDGTFEPIAVPGASETQAFGINNAGQIVGLYANNGVHGFVRDSNGSFSTIDVPGAQTTYAWSINDSGQIVGIAMVSDRNYAFIATPVSEPTPITVSLPIDNFDNSLPSSTIVIEPVMTTLIDPTTTNGINYVGFQGDFTFDSAVVGFATPQVQGAGLTGNNWNVSSNVLNTGPGTIKTLRVNAFSLDFTPLFGSGLLFNMKMRRVSNTPGDTSPLVWKQPPDDFFFIDDNL